MSGDDDDNSDYIDGSCLECGAGPDEHCAMDCCQSDEEDEDDDAETD